MGGREGGREMKTARREKMVKEAKKQMRLAGPLIAANMLLTFLQVISTVVVGHIGEQVLAGAALAISFASVTGFSMLMGMGCGLETLCGQAFGAKNYHMLGVQLQTAMLVLSVACIPVAFMWFFADGILVFLRQDPEISAKAAVYVRWMLPSLFAYGLIQCQIRFLQAQNIVSPLMLSTAATALFHAPASWVLVHKTGLGYKGAALASSISYWINVLLLAFYIKLSPACKRTWSGFSKEAFHGLVVFLKLAVPSATMICLEYWAFEAVVILSGLLPNPKLVTSSMSIGLSTCSVVYTITFGLGAAISTRVSNELGAGNPGAARLAISVMAVISTIEGFAVGLTLIFLRNIWAQAYSKDKEVVTYVASILPLISAVHLLDAFQCLFTGIARGCGWQKICAIIDLGSFYIAGIPIAVVLTFMLHVGGKGLWTGVICALVVQVALLAMLTFRSDFNREAEKARERIQGIAQLQECCSKAEEWQKQEDGSLKSTTNLVETDQPPTGR